MGSVADTGTTVLLSSHLLADLERVCDFLVVLDSARVRLTGTVEDVLAGHRLLVGPRHGGEPIGGVASVIRASHTDRQSTLLVATDGPVTDPAWKQLDVDLEELILAYLAGRSVTTSHEAWGVPA
jgi:ABC-2 type transport system ATP-binding protein